MIELIKKRLNMYISTNQRWASNILTVIKKKNSHQLVYSCTVRDDANTQDELTGIVGQQCSTATKYTY